VVRLQVGGVDPRRKPGINLAQHLAPVLAPAAGGEEVREAHGGSQRERALAAPARDADRRAEVLLGVAGMPAERQQLAAEAGGFRREEAAAMLRRGRPKDIAGGLQGVALGRAARQRAEAEDVAPHRPTRAACAYAVEQLAERRLRHLARFRAGEQYRPVIDPAGEAVARA